MGTTRYGNVEVDTTEVDKQVEIVKTGRPGAVQEFLDWLLDEKKWVLARFVEEDEREPNDGIYGEQPIPVFVNRQDLMAEFFGVDLKKVEQERRAILDAIREKD